MPQLGSYKANINDWAQKLWEIRSLVDFARKIDEPRNVWFENLTRFNLPQIPTYLTSLKEFIGNIDWYFKKLGSDRCYFSLMPRISDLKRFGDRDVTKEQTLKFIGVNIIDADISNYNIQIWPYNDNIIWWSIIVNENGNFIFEFKRWTQTEIAKWTVEPDELFFVKKDDFLNTFNFSFDDAYLKNVSLKVLMAVPHEWKWRNIKFMPGYYEVVSVKKEWVPAVYFLDYRDNNGYSMNLF